ncbi:hypothetical protein Tco_0159434, partial [Tanacetum coccineum]
KVLATEWITLAIRLALIDTGLMLQVQHQGLSCRFGIQLVEQAVAQASLLERLLEIPVRSTRPQVASPPTCPHSWDKNSHNTSSSLKTKRQWSNIQKKQVLDLLILVSTILIP